MPPNDILIRATAPVPAVEEDGRTLFGRVASANEWAEIDSVTEGHFLERHAPGAFRKTFAENRDKIRVLFQHGRDAEMGTRPIAEVPELGEDDIGPFYRAALLDGVPEMIRAGLRAGVYGSSHSFSVVREDWERAPKGGPHNPKRLPERTIREVKVYELGPVTWPAYAGSTASVRSLTDDFPPTLPVAPSLDAEPEAAHLEPERRDEPVEPIAATQPKETVPVDISQYHSLDEMGARVRELNEQIKRDAEVPGILPDSLQAQHEEAVAERGQLEAAMAAWKVRIAQVREAAADPERAEPTYVAPAIIRSKSETDIYDLDTIYRSARSVEDRGVKLRDNALRAAEQLRVPSARYDQDASRERLANLLDYKDSEDKELARRVLATNSPQYRAAFGNYVASGGIERGTALAVGVDATGGYAVPVSLDPTIVATGAWTAINPYRQACRIETIVGTDTWQALTATAITAAWAAEAAAATEQGPTFARPEFVAKRGHAYVTASYEMVGDRPNLPAELGQLFGEAKDTLEENSFSIGAGTTVYPQGMGLKDAFTRVDSITNDTFAVGDVTALAAALPIRERMNAAWFLSRAAIMAIQALETTGGQLFSGTNYAATPPPASRPNGNTGLTLLGFPVYETPSMPWTPTTDDTTWGVLCNPKNYVILDRVGASIRVIENVMDGATPSMPTGEIGIYYFWRGTARVLYAGGGRQGAIQ